MPTIQLTSGSSLWAELTFEETKIWAVGKSYPQLIVPMFLRTRPAGGHGQLLQLGGILRLAERSQEPLIADVRPIPFDITFQDHGFSLEIPFQQPQIKTVEDTRGNRGPAFKLEIWTLVAQLSGSSVQAFTVLRGDCGFQIPKDLWVESLLPTIGYGCFRLVAVSSPAFAEDQDFQEKVLAELESAEAAFRGANYDNVVIKCRNALQALVSLTTLDLKGKPASFHNRAIAFCEQVLQPEVGKTKAQLLQPLLLAPWGLCRTPRKSPT